MFDVVHSTLYFPDSDLDLDRSEEKGAAIEKSPSTKGPLGPPMCTSPATSSRSQQEGRRSSGRAPIGAHHHHHPKKDAWLDGGAPLTSKTLCLA
jgi:hypothetical protein